MKSPGCCGSVDWVLAWESKGCRFDSQSGHRPGLQARSPVGGVQEAATHWCFSSSLFPSPFFSLKINKFLKSLKKEWRKNIKGEVRDFLLKCLRTSQTSKTDEAVLCPHHFVWLLWWSLIYENVESRLAWLKGNSFTCHWMSCQQALVSIRRN